MQVYVIKDIFIKDDMQKVWVYYSIYFIYQQKNKLQIVAEEDTFNTNIKFSKRVTIKPDKLVSE